MDPDTSTPSPDLDEESVVLSSFESRLAAEQMLAALGGKFRRHHRGGKVAAFVISENRDGSLKLTQSRVLTAGGVGAAVIGIAVATIAGLIGTFSFLRGGRSVAQAGQKRAGHVGSDAHRAHQILREAGPKGALTLVRCTDQDEARAVAEQAAARAIDSWHGSRAEFLAGVDQLSGDYGWLRAAFDMPGTDPDTA